ncbi:MAG: hypothetical protein E7L17_04035 [Clostridium sp.]|uniref:hypothetical protein n=1 Tax=Clostridium sp. TaxID=1506 RepID=UPI00290ED6F5|nr:hypothetical protein [Clostridium sp.]MDU7337264.1 hypothetical protein [Clostridium sp.]
MARSSADFWNDRVSNGNNRISDSDDRESMSRGGNSDCDRESSKALKTILSQLDDLNNSDLRLLNDIIERLLCTRRC